VCGKLRAATILLPQVQSAAAYRRREARRCFGLHASPHALQPQARLPRSGALPAAQASLTALPDELLRGILQCAWADRPPHDAGGGGGACCGRPGVRVSPHARATAQNAAAAGARLQRKALGRVRV